MVRHLGALLIALIISPAISGCAQAEDAGEPIERWRVVELASRNIVAVDDGSLEQVDGGVRLMAAAIFGEPIALPVGTMTHLRSEIHYSCPVSTWEERNAWHFSEDTLLQSGATGVPSEAIEAGSENALISAAACAGDLTTLGTRTFGSYEDLVTAARSALVEQ